jgi:hypothetical protein
LRCWIKRNNHAICLWRRGHEEHWCRNWSKEALGEMIITCFSVWSSVSLSGTSPTYWVGQHSSACQRKNGPVHQQHVGWKALIFIALQPSLTGLRSTGTCLQSLGDDTSGISLRRLATNGRNRRLSSLMYCNVVIESDQKNVLEIVARRRLADVTVKTELRLVVPNEGLTILAQVHYDIFQWQKHNGFAQNHSAFVER